MNATKVKGAAKEAAAKVEGAAGVLSGDAGLELNGRIDELAGVAQKSFGEAVEMGEQAVTRVRDFVEEEPWKAVAIAAAIGLLIGLAVRR
jgi:ElaB/YqjD/DUF883 family membrane-anchored ribosome-binding protein